MSTLDLPIALRWCPDVDLEVNVLSWLGLSVACARARHFFAWTFVLSSDWPLKNSSLFLFLPCTDVLLCTGNWSWWRPGCTSSETLPAANSRPLDGLLTVVKTWVRMGDIEDKSCSGGDNFEVGFSFVTWIEFTENLDSSATSGLESELMTGKALSGELVLDSALLASESSRVFSKSLRLEVFFLRKPGLSTEASALPLVTVVEFTGNFLGPSGTRASSTLLNLVTVAVVKGNALSLNASWFDSTPMTLSGFTQKVNLGWATSTGGEMTAVALNDLSGSGFSDSRESEKSTLEQALGGLTTCDRSDPITSRASFTDKDGFSASRLWSCANCPIMGSGLWKHKGFPNLSGVLAGESVLFKTLVISLHSALREKGTSLLPGVSKNLSAGTKTTTGEFFCKCISSNFSVTKTCFDISGVEDGAFFLMALDP